MLSDLCLEIDWFSCGERLGRGAEKGKGEGEKIFEGEGNPPKRECAQLVGPQALASTELSPKLRVKKQRVLFFDNIGSCVIDLIIHNRSPQHTHGCTADLESV